MMLTLDPVSKNTSTCLKLILTWMVISSHVRCCWNTILFFGVLLWGRKLEHLVAKPLAFAARLVGFSDTWTAVEEKRMGDFERITDTEMRVYIIS
ncbi:hypothetical protein TNCV_4279941 [Trichonephila clavipes]|nr:hypothetical protein TNCV_4279941 [Trichonephila clavipes]